MTGFELLVGVVALNYLFPEKTEGYADAQARKADEAAARAKQKIAAEAERRAKQPPGNDTIIFWSIALLLSCCAMWLDSATGWKIFFVSVSGWFFLLFSWQRLSA